MVSIAMSAKVLTPKPPKKPGRARLHYLISISDELKPIGRRVISIVNYDSFWVDPEIFDQYLDLVRYIETNYYLKVSRYTTNGFMRLKLPRGLQERDVTSGVVQILSKPINR